jgi:hypothetical protein
MEVGMTIESVAILTFCDGQRREAPLAQVLLTRWELGVLGVALRWPIADDAPLTSGGRFLAAAAHRYAPQAEPAAVALAAAESAVELHGDEVEEPDTGDSGYWLDAAQVQRIYANLANPSTREAILGWAARAQTPVASPDRLIVCLQMLARASNRNTGIHFAYYLC